MIRYLFPFILICAAAVLPQIQFDEKDEAERQQYGLSEAEWGLYKQSGMSIDELKRLIECGIGMNEYNSRPWISVGVSEKEWLAEKCRGLSNEAIQAFNEKGESDAGVLAAFFLPGYYHWTHKSYGKAAAFSGVFVASVGLFFLWTYEDDESPPQAVAGGSSTTTTETRYRPVFLVFAAADMVMSAVFAYRDLNKIKQQAEEPPPATSLQFNIRDNRPGVQAIYRF